MVIGTDFFFFRKIILSESIKRREIVFYDGTTTLYYNNNYQINAISIPIYTIIFYYFNIITRCDENNGLKITDFSSRRFCCIRKRILYKYIPNNNIYGIILYYPVTGVH